MKLLSRESGWGLSDLTFKGPGVYLQFNVRRFQHAIPNSVALRSVDYLSCGMMLNLYFLSYLRGSQLVNFRSGGCFGNGLPAAFIAQ